MSNSEIELKQPSDDEFVAEIPPVRRFRSSLARAVKQGWPYALLSGLAFDLFFTVVFTWSYGTSDGFVGRFLTKAIDFLPASLIVMGIVLLPILFWSLWKERALNRRGRIRIEEGRLEVTRPGVLGEKTVFSDDVDRVQMVQRGSVENNDLREVLPAERSEEVALVTEDDMHVLAFGLEPSESEQLAESVEQTVFAEASSKQSD